MKALLLMIGIFALLVLAGCNGGTNPDSIYPGGGYSDNHPPEPLVYHSKLPVAERE